VADLCQLRDVGDYGEQGMRRAEEGVRGEGG